MKFNLVFVQNSWRFNKSNKELGLLILVKWDRDIANILNLNQRKRY